MMQVAVIVLRVGEAVRMGCGVWSLVLGLGARGLGGKIVRVAARALIRDSRQQVPRGKASGLCEAERTSAAEAQLKYMEQCETASELACSLPAGCRRLAAAFPARSWLFRLSRARISAGGTQGSG